MNQGYAYHSLLTARDEGRSLLDHLRGCYRHSTEAQWRERIEAGLVLLDGAAAEKETLLRAGQTLTWMRPPWDEPEAPLDFAVLHEDTDLLVVAKPAGLPTLPGAQFLEHTLLHQVRKRNPEAAPIHRLGRGTSGLLIFARNEAASRALAAALRERRLTKIYLALVEGEPRQDTFDIDVPIGPVFHGTLGTLHAASPEGRPALSHARVLERRGDASLVEVRIETGRPHQIRIHLAACGHPLVGDPLYLPGGLPRAAALPGDLGYLLHAWRLSLPHPRTGERLDLECAPPPALRLKHP